MAAPPSPLLLFCRARCRGVDCLVGGGALRGQAGGGTGQRLWRAEFRYVVQFEQSPRPETRRLKSPSRRPVRRSLRSHGRRRVGSGFIIHRWVDPHQQRRRAAERRRAQCGCCAGAISALRNTSRSTIFQAAHRTDVRPSLALAADGQLEKRVVTNRSRFPTARTAFTIERFSPRSRSAAPICAPPASTTEPAVLVRRLRRARRRIDLVGRLPDRRQQHRRRHRWLALARQRSDRDLQPRHHHRHQTQRHQHAGVSVECGHLPRKLRRAGSQPRRRGGRDLDLGPQ